MSSKTEADTSRGQAKKLNFFAFLNAQASIPLIKAPYKFLTFVSSVCDFLVPVESNEGDL